MLELNINFKIAGWDEVTYSEVEGGGRLSRADVKRTFTGDLNGDGTLEYLLVYEAGGNAVYTGYERVTGQIRERTGSFVLKHEGTFINGTADAVCTVVEDSGTDGLKGIKGRGSFSAGHAEEHPMTLQIEFV